MTWPNNLAPSFLTSVPQVGAYRGACGLQGSQRIDPSTVGWPIKPGMPGHFELLETLSFYASEQTHFIVFCVYNDMKNLG